MPVSSGDVVKNREDLTSLGSDDSGILCSSDGDATTRESSVEQLASIDHSRESLNSTLASSTTSDDSITEKPAAKEEVSLPLTKRILMSKKITFFSKKTSSKDSDLLKNKEHVEEVSPNCGEVETEVEIDSEKLNSVKTENSENSDNSASCTLKPFEASHSDGKSLLLRLFESKLFDMSMAIKYLSESKEPGVQSYIGNKLFNYPDSEVDFYLPQLVCMYLQMPDVAEVIHPYLVRRCRDSADFSLKCAWLLDAYSSDAQVPSKKKSNGTKLKNLILSDRLRPKESENPIFVKESKFRRVFSKTVIVTEPPEIVPSSGYLTGFQHEGGPCYLPSAEEMQPPPPPPPLPSSFLAPSVKTHQRSKSDASGLIQGDKKKTTFGESIFSFF